MAYTLYTLAERPELRPQIEALGKKCWPEFLQHGDAHHWHVLFEEYAAYQLLLCDSSGQLLTVGHCIPLVWDGSLADLPATIEEILVRAEAVHDAKQRPNTFSALAAMVDPSKRGEGLSRAVILEMKALARKHGCRALIAPVRPTWKSRYPLTPLGQYAGWKRPDGAPLDPWLRVHWRMGAVPLCVAPKALTVEGSVTEWEQWAQMAFPESGLYIVPGALQPVVIDCEQGKGRYEDPNYWMKHPVAP